MISGELRVVPDEALATELATLGDRPLLTIATICLDRAGAHTAVVTRPSQAPAFDRAAVEVASAWRFRPYVDRDVAMPVCGLAAFRYGVTPTRDGGPPPADWYDALPPAERELPASTYFADGVRPDQRSLPPTPGVAMMRICRRRGDVGPPQLVWLQSSGDPSFDRDLFDRRITVAVDEPRDGATVCNVIADIRRPGPRVAAATTRRPSVSDEVLEARRISGQKNIMPTDAIRDEIQRTHGRAFIVPVRVCIDETGRPDEVELLGTSGFAGYDMDFINGVAAWRYSPFTIGGTPAPACGMVNFSYRQS